jgi:hypothetical protein
MGFGSGGFGAVPFGATFSAGPSVRLAYVSSRNAIDVEFTGPLSAVDATIATDALNPDNWALTVPVLSTAFLPFVQVVESYDGGARIRVIFDADLTDGETYIVTVDGAVLDVTGAPVSAPLSAEVIVPTLGFVSVTDSLPRELRTDIRSVAGAKAVSGTPRYDETGDLANESGADYLKKRILRRAALLRGSVFHLPNYGAGKRLKTVITPAWLSNYQAEMKAQVLLEPDVSAVVVTVTRLASNIVRVAIRPTTVQGEIVPQIVFTVDTNG